jgi:hypothetical protein
MDKLFYAIWKDVEDRNVSGAKDLIGYFHGTWEEGDKLVCRMNEEDEEVAKEFRLFPGQSPRYGYWKQELTEVTLKNYKEWLPQ